MIELTAQMIRYAAGHRMGSHSDGHRRLSVVIRGAQEERRQRRTAPASAGSVALKDAELVHQNEFSRRGATIVSVLLPDEALDRLGHRPRGLLPWEWRHDHATALTGIRLATALRSGTPLEIEECLHALLRGFASDPGGGGFVASRDLARVRDRLHQDPAREPSLRELGNSVGMHPASLGRAFRRTFGCSITRYRQRLRALAVARALADGDRALTALALDQDFADLSHMTRIFRREVGTSPGRFRAAMRPGPSGFESFKTEWTVRV